MPPQIRGLALCAGAGGLELGIGLALPAYRTVAYVERAPAAIAVLQARMRDECLHRAPVYPDLRTFDGRPWRRRIDLLSAGYPCQPFSLSGRRRGFSDGRNLWPDVARIIDQARPGEVFLENVAAHLSLGFPVVARDLRGMGYTFVAGVFSAGEVGSTHERRRLFVLAHANGLLGRRSRGHIAHPWRPARQAQRQGREPGATRARGVPLVASGFAPGPLDFEGWAQLLAADPTLEPALLRDAPGVARSLERQHLTGNGVCSLAAAYAYTSLKADLYGRTAGELARKAPAAAVGRPGQGTL